MLIFCVCFLIVPAIELCIIMVVAVGINEVIVVTVVFATVVDVFVVGLIFMVGFGVCGLLPMQIMHCSASSLTNSLAHDDEA